MRMGLFGGTFNPIHCGHLRAAAEVKKRFKLDQIFIIPAALPPHKTPVTVADAADRLEMIKLAISGIPGIMVSDVELKRRGPSYTIATVYHFKQTQPTGALIYLIMGLDAFLEIDTWKSYLELLEQVPFIVMARPNAQHPDTQQGWKILGDYLKARLAAEYQFSVPQNSYLSDGKQPIHICDVGALDISSTAIRQDVKNNQTIENWVPAEVAEYIKHKGLYK